jgi:hypothetical protein
MLEEVSFLKGIPIGYGCGDVTRLNEDMQLLKPTVSLYSPRLHSSWS